MTLDQIEQDVYRRLGKNTSSVDTSTQTRIRAFVNQRIRELLTKPDCSEFRDLVTTFASVASTAATDLPVTVQRINLITDTANSLVLEERPLEWYRRVSPDGTSEGTPTHYVVHGLVETAADVFKLRILLWPTPAAIVTYTLDYTAAFTDLASSTDVPPIPEDFHRLIVYGACVDECIKTSDERLAIFKQEWREGLSDLMYWLHARPGYQPGSASGRVSGNNLGAGYPAGRW